MTRGSLTSARNIEGPVARLTLMRQNPALVRSVRLQPDLAGAIILANTRVSHPGRLIALAVGAVITTCVTRSRPAEAGHYDRKRTPTRVEIRRVLSH